MTRVQKNIDLLHENYWIFDTKFGTTRKIQKPTCKTHNCVGMLNVVVVWLGDAILFLTIYHISANTVKLGDKELFGHPKIVP